jgi:hypothetical protein
VVDSRDHIAVLLAFAGLNDTTFSPLKPRAMINSLSPWALKIFMICYRIGFTFTLKIMLSLQNISKGSLGPLEIDKPSEKDEEHRSHTQSHYNEIRAFFTQNCPAESLNDSCHWI